MFFSTYDAIAGLATGWLHHVADGQSGAEQAATLRAADELFNENWLAGNVSVAGSVSAIAWAVIAIAGAVALRRAGADGLTVGLMAASVLRPKSRWPSNTRAESRLSDFFSPTKLGAMADIRVLTPDDWRVWRDLRLAALAEAPEAFGSVLADWTGAPEQRWRERLSVPGSHNVVALLDGEPAGMACGMTATGGAAALVSMWVAPHARGHGIGDALVAAIVAWAESRGARTIQLDVVETNAAASALYERHGFTVTGAREELLRGVHRELIMTRRPPARENPALTSSQGHQPSAARCSATDSCTSGRGTYSHAP